MVNRKVALSKRLINSSRRQLAAFQRAVNSFARNGLVNARGIAHQQNPIWPYERRGENRPDTLNVLRQPSWRGAEALRDADSKRGKTAAIGRATHDAATDLYQLPGKD
jgi:hypothetical protein